MDGPRPRLQLEVQSFLVPKQGSSPSECEDAIWPPEGGDPRSITAPYHVAMADGASESMRAGRWATLLTQVTVEVMQSTGDWWADLVAFSKALVDAGSSRWEADLDAYRRTREASDRPIQWYEEPGLAKGAFATLLALELSPTSDGWDWQAVALGDSCLFRTHTGVFVDPAFPMARGSDFGITPDLLGSRLRDSNLVAARLTTDRGRLHEGDELLLTTDALAAWLLSGHEQGEVRLPPLLRLLEEDPAALPEWIAHQRTGSMRNDDVAVVRLRVRTTD